MSKRLTRQQLYALAWDRPMTKLAAEFGLSDVALHKICRKHRVPTPPAGYWAKRAYGKPVSTTPLLDPHDKTEILLRESAASNEPIAVAEARVKALAAATTEAIIVPNPILDRTLAKLNRARKASAGLVHVEGDGVIRISVRPESVERAGNVLRQFVLAGEAAAMKLAKGQDAATWQFDEETISFELVEVADQVEHVATEKELATVETWKRKREEDHRRYGYWRDWGEPKIPKWEQRYQGRLAIKLEEVRIQTELSWWGETIRRTFSDTKTRDVTRLIPRAVSTIAAIAAAKKHNRDMEGLRHAAAEAEARLRAEAERKRMLDQRAGILLDELIQENAKAEQHRAVIDQLRQGVTSDEPRLLAFVHWAEERLQVLEARLAPAGVEKRLADAKLFGDE